ncbi:MAG TPA: hypothetical protein VG454_01925 [Gemmatimonadales bacterium]|nr:hypothetical protein [Gemmatimonadales bacterium]
MNAKNGDAKLEALAKHLGASAADRLDVDAVARRVLAELRQAPVRRRTWIEVHWLRIAAAMVILVGGGLLVQQMIPDTDVPGQHGNHLVADDLGDLTTDQLRDVLDRFDEMVGGTTPLLDSSSDLRGLDEEQLQNVLRSIGGII